MQTSFHGILASFFDYHPNASQSLVPTRYSVREPFSYFTILALKKIPTLSLQNKHINIKQAIFNTKANEG